ncbi:MAG: diacylglycerol kinase family protein [Candidatus Kaiserbacteria bacterium]|nr:diacylglycerol kinase family protein [Candidatus Kaiserbacteria bacterium]
MKHFIRGFSYACTGLTLAWKEYNFKIEVVCAMLVTVLGFLWHISAFEFACVVLAISIVLAAEAFNTALEELCDKFEPTHDPHIAKIKDLAAAAVLISSLGALGIGLIIFMPYI